MLKKTNEHTSENEVKLYASNINPKTYKESNVIEILEKTFIVDGYSFGDRLLEGVNFIIKFENNKVINIEVDEDSKEYFESLNSKKWLKCASEYAQKIIDEGDEVMLPFYLENKYFVNRNIAYIR